MKSLVAQVSSLTRYVSNHEGWLLVDVYMDTGSDRTQFHRLVNDCKSHDLDTVVAESLSSFGRDKVEVAEAVRLLHECGVKIDFMEKDLKEGNRPVNHSEAIRMGLKDRAEQGTSGLYKKPCFGYKKNSEGNLVLDDEQAMIVKKIFGLYLSGQSISSIIRTLAEEKIPSLQGSETWSKRTISTILTNIKYTGNVQVLKSDPSRASFCMWDSHEAIISSEDFARVQEEINRRAKKKRVGGRRENMNLAGAVDSEATNDAKIGGVN